MLVLVPGLLILDVGSCGFVDGIVLDGLRVQLDDGDVVLLHSDGGARWADCDLWRSGGRRAD